MSVPAFKLEEAGFSRPQVEALAEFLNLQAASKTDLLEVEHRLDARIGQLEQKIADGKIDLIKWVVGVGIAQVGLILAVLKLFAH